MNKEEIIISIINDNDINKYIHKNILYTYKKAFVSFFHLQLCEIKESKLIDAYEKNYLKYLCIRIIKNKYFKRDSTFWKEVKGKLNVNNSTIQFMSIDDMYDLEIEDNDYSNEIKTDLSDIDKLLNHYDPIKVYLFKEFYYKDKTYQEISNDTNIKYDVIRSSVMEVLEYLKSNFNNDKEIY